MDMILYFQYYFISWCNLLSKKIIVIFYQKKYYYFISWCNLLSKFWLKVGLSLREVL